MIVNILNGNLFVILYLSENVLEIVESDPRAFAVSSTLPRQQKKCYERP